MRMKCVRAYENFYTKCAQTSAQSRVDRDRPGCKLTNMGGRVMENKHACLRIDSFPSHRNTLARVRF